jgi:hypothetical protein
MCSHLRLSWWVKGWPLYLFLGYLSRRRCVIFLLVYKWDECQHLFLFIEFGKMSKTSLQNLQDSKPHNLGLFKKRPDAEFIVFCTHFQNRFSTWEIQTSFYGPHICCWYISFSRFPGLGTRATFVADPSSLCKIKLCSHSPKKKAQKQCDRPNPLLD